jgi:peroxiredoxin
MQKTLPWLWLLLLPLLARAQQPFTYSISGHLGQVPASAKVYLVPAEVIMISAASQQVLDSAQVRSGYFALHGTSQWPKQVRLWLVPTGRPPQGSCVSYDTRTLFLEPTPVVLSSPDLLRHATCKGGSTNREYDQYTAQSHALADKMLPKGRSTESHELRSYSQQWLALTGKFVGDHPASWVSLELLRWPQMGRPQQYDELAPLYANLSPALRNSAPGQACARQLADLQTVALGATAPDLTLPTATGQPVAVRDFRGRYLLLEFWVAADQYTVELAPTLALYRKYANRNLAVLGVSLDDKAHRSQWLQTVHDHNLPWSQVSDLLGFTYSPVVGHYHLDSTYRAEQQNTQQNFLLDPEGKIIAVNLYGEELDVALAKFLPPFSLK